MQHPYGGEGLSGLEKVTLGVCNTYGISVDRGVINEILIEVWERVGPVTFDEVIDIVENYIVKKALREVSQSELSS